MPNFDPDRSRCVDLVDSDANAAPLNFDEPDPFFSILIIGGLGLAVVAGGGALLWSALA